MSGFGFYPSSLWSMFGPMRQAEGGNHTDEEVCGMMSIYWEMKNKGEDEGCPPQWDGVTACIPSTSLNTLAVLPCIQHYNGQFFDTKCKLKDFFKRIHGFCVNQLFFEISYFMFVYFSF